MKTMHDLPRQKLLELIECYGLSLCEDPRRLEALLKDHCGQHKREIFVLVSALRERVAADLLRERGTTPASLLLPRLASRLHGNLGLAEDIADWTVEAWAWALKIPLPQKANSPAAPVAKRAADASVARPKTRLNHSEAVLALKRQQASSAATQASSVVRQPKPPLIDGRYLDHGDGTLTDIQTKLQWMRCSLGQAWDGATVQGEAQQYTWAKALLAAEELNRAGGFANCRDWRVPSIDELKSLVIRGQRPTINPKAFPATAPRAYWSSSPHAGYSGSAWSVYFYDGYGYGYVKVNAYSVRLVRSGQ
jgi:hypothetical protein